MKIAKGFIEVKGITGILHYIAIDHIVRIRGYNGPSKLKGPATIIQTTMRDAETNSTITIYGTIEELMEKIDAERALIRALEKSTSSTD